MMYIDLARMSVEKILTAHFKLEEQDELLSLEDALGAAIVEPIYAEFKAVHNALVKHNDVDRTLERLRDKKLIFKC